MVGVGEGDAVGEAVGASVGVDELVVDELVVDEVGLAVAAGLTVIDTMLD